MFSRSIVIIAVIGISTNWKLQQRECKISLVVFNTLSLTKKKNVFDRFCNTFKRRKKEEEKENKSKNNKEKKKRRENLYIEREPGRERMLGTRRKRCRVRKRKRRRRKLFVWLVS